MKKILLSLVILFATMFATFGQSNKYFVSSIGDDNNSGLSIKASWKTLDRVNREIFKPGDAIYFRSGDVWKGLLHPQGSGSEGKPIIIDCYGDGSMPVINMGEAKGAAVKLLNQEWWIIQNLEVTSGVPPKLEYGRQGIVALVDGADKYTGHIVIRNCYIHDIWGQLGGDSLYTQYNGTAIYAGQTMGRSGGGTTSDILIENNRIERFDRCGIVIWRGGYNIIIRGNVLDNLGGDGIFANGCIRGVIERNIAKRTCMHSGDPDLVMKSTSYNPATAAIWIQNCLETVMQFNEVYDTGRQKGNADGEAYDFDTECKDCIAQYNYSRNNHGFLLIMDRTFGNIARYNISENDQAHLFQMLCDTSDLNILYNNVFYVDYGTIDVDYYTRVDIPDQAKGRIGAKFRNNIFYATGQGRFRTVYTFGNILVRVYNDKVKLPHPAPGTQFYHNWYFGPWLNGLPDDPEKMEGDPMFVAAGTGGIGLETLSGYKLRPESPCINRGVFIPMNGGRDFYGNPVYDGAPDIGAFEQLGSGAVRDTLLENKLTSHARAVSSFTWAKRKFPDMAVVPSEGGNVVLGLTQPYQGSAFSLSAVVDAGEALPKSTLTWSGPDWSVQPKTADFSNKNKNSLTFKITPAKMNPSMPVLTATLQNGEQKEEWNIPVYFSHKVDMGNLPNSNVDGDMTKWKNIPSLVVNSSSQVFQLREKWQGPQDGSCSLKAAISGEKLLLTIEATDKDISYDASVPSMNDAVEICFNTRMTAVPGGRPGGGAAIGQIILVAQEKDGAVEKAYWLQRRNPVPLPPEIKTFYHRTSNGYTMEVSVPLTLMGLKTIPAKGESIALEVVLDNHIGPSDSSLPIRMSGSGYANYLTNSRAYSRFVIK